MSAAAAASYLFITALIFDENCIFLLMYVGCLAFVLREMCETLWKSRDVLVFYFSFFSLQTLTSLLYFFFLTRQIKLVIIYCQDVNYDHLFTRCTRCPPACLCVHERSVDGVTGHRRTWWRWYRECMCYLYNVECCSFLVHERFMKNVCTCTSVCAWARLLFLNTYLPRSGKWINLTARIRKERIVCKCECVCTFDWLLCQLKSSKTLALCLLSCF